MKELTESQVNNIKEKLIKFKNELIQKNKINNRIKKDLNNYNGIKDIRYLLNEYEDKYEDIRYLFNKNECYVYYVEEMKSLGSAEIKNIFKNELIRKNRINNGIKKILTIAMEILNTKLLKI